MNHWNLEGKTAVVTGASRGMAKAAVEEMLGLGAEVLFLARSADRIREMEAEYREKGWKARGMVADIGEAAQREAIYEKAAGWWDRLDILVNNVGINVKKPTLEVEIADLQTVMELNVGAALDLCQRFHPLLKASGDGRIINVSSIAAQTGMMWTTAIYAMSKAAMDRMTKYLAVEWGKDGIRVNAVNPWFIRTERVARVTEDTDKMRQIEAATPLGRIGEAEEAARVITFLAMPASSYLSGLCIPVDGAFSQVGIL